MFADAPYAPDADGGRDTDAADSCRRADAPYAPNAFPSTRQIETGPKRRSRVEGADMNAAEALKAARAAGVATRN